MKSKKIDIHKAAGTIIIDRRFLVERSSGKSIFGHPGGKLEPGETPKQALIREFREELTIHIKEEDLEFFGTFYGEAARNPGSWLRMDVFTVKKFTGEITPSSEVEEVVFINSNIPDGMEISSIARHEILPRLKELDLID